MQVTPKQWFLIVSSIISSLITGAALLNPLMGEALALKVVAGLGILNIILGSVNTVLFGQSQIVKDVAAMPGVERITVNKDANQALAALAIDKNVDKVAPTASAVDDVLKTAKG